MVTLFLLARIAEDEAAASECVRLDADVANLAGWVEIGSDEVDAAEALGSRFNPARVLAECEAKRRIVARIQMSQMMPVQISDHAADAILRALVLPYADHPHYDEAWRP